MNTASLDLCKELYKLSGWDGVSYWYDSNGTTEIVLSEKRASIQNQREVYAENEVPAYDLGYLLRKLPQTGTNKQLRLIRGTVNWQAELTRVGSKTILGIANTPEDAACKLAIELFKQGVL